MKKLFVFASLSVMLLVSCAKEISKEEQPKPAGDFIGSVTVAFEDSTKATLGEPVDGVRKVTWNTGDRICVNGSVSDALDSKFDGKLAADFTFTENPLSKSGSYLACYPASVYKNAGQVTLPAVQGDVQGANKALAFPLAGKLESSDDYLHISLKQLCGFIRLKLQGNSDLSCVSFQTNGEEKVSGDFDIVFDESGIPTISKPEGEVSAADKRVSVTCTPTLSAKDSYCVIAVPAQEYAGGLTLSLATQDDKYFVSNSTKSKTITRAQVTNISNTFDVSKGNYVEIASAADWNKFAGHFNDGDFYTSDVKVNITADLDFKDLTPVSVGSYPGEKYCSAIISGNNHIISNFVSGEPLVGSIDTNGSLTDLTFDETCSFAPDLCDGVKSYFGPFTDYLKGEIRNCVNKGNITINRPTSGTGAIDKYCGGIAARIREGEMINCKNYGTITSENAKISSKALYTGGLVGWLSNADGVVNSCENHGAITNNATAEPLVAGGIAGKCIGTVKNCTNDASLTVTTTRATKDPCKNIFLGGVVGICAGVQLDSCSNSGVIVSESNVKLQYIGGITGQVLSTSSIGYNTNTGNIDAKKNGRQYCIGGVIGLISTEGDTYKFKGTPSTGTITISGKEAGSTCYFYIGGLVGRAAKAVTIEGVELSSQCNLLVQNNNASTNLDNVLALGGVLGSAAGAPTIKNCSLDKASITIDCASGTGLFATNFGIGGILGYSNADATIDNCDINILTLSISSLSNGISATNLGVGGAYGFAAAGSTIKNCDITSASITINSQTTDITSTNLGMGGMLGYSSGAAIISDCSVAAGNGISIEFPNVATLISCTDFGMGGMLGCSILGASVENCYVNIPMGYNKATPSKNTTKFNLGGITGRLYGGDSKIKNCIVGSQTLANLHYNNNGIGQTTGNTVGGIIGSFGQVSGNQNKISIEGCSSSANLYIYRCAAGGIAGFLDRATVTNCTSIGAITLASYAGGLVAYAANSSFTGCTFNCASGILSTHYGSCNNYAGGLAGQTVACSFANCSAYFGTTNGIKASGTNAADMAPGALIGYSDADSKITACKAGGLLQAATTGMPGASSIKSATLDETTVVSYAIGNCAMDPAPTAENVSLWDGK